MPYNPNKHHRRSIRLKGYDYTQAGLYFVTICLQDRKWLFGKIENGVTGERNYWEHIIRDERAYHRISEYIIHNPKNWENDKLK